MIRSPAPVRWTVIDTVSFLLIGSVAGRLLPYYLSTGDRWVVVGLLALYLFLFTITRFSARMFPILQAAYFVAQTGIALFLILGLSNQVGPQDYFAMLILPLCIQATWNPAQRAGAAWVAFFALTMATSMVVYYRMYQDSWEGLGYGLAYIAACVMVSTFAVVTRRAEDARRQTQALNAELQAANEKLQAYARQVEQLAHAEERARLARDLHDSVSQTIFTMTLTAQAARILLDRDLEQAAGQLDHLQALAQNALAEMRSLIRQLRPGGTPQGGLAGALRRHAETRRAQDGLDVELAISGDRRLPPEVEDALFRVVQEALNNVVKHARVSTARVTLRLDQNPIVLCVEDRGVGFSVEDLVQPAGGSRLGLAGMSERVQLLGGRLEIESAPGLGTRVEVKDLMIQEEGHA